MLLAQLFKNINYKEDFIRRSYNLFNLMTISRLARFFGGGLSVKRLKF